VDGTHHDGPRVSVDLGQAVFLSGVTRGLSQDLVLALAPDHTRASAHHLAGMHDPQLTALRDHCRRLPVRALDVLTAVWLGRGDVQLALHVAQDVVALEPFREQGYRSLMRCHLTAGNRAEALRVYADCRALLADELGVEPAPETAGVYLEALAAGG
jgi:hypothetical protein